MSLLLQTKKEIRHGKNRKKYRAINSCELSWGTSKKKKNHNNFGKQIIVIDGGRITELTYYNIISQT